MLGLKAVAEYLVDGLPRITTNYYKGFTTAWEAGRDATRKLEQNYTSKRDWSLYKASGYIADGHVALALLLLNAIIAYLARGKSMQALAQEARGGRLGDRFADWLLRNEDRLRRQTKLEEPRFVVSRPSRAAGETTAPGQQSHHNHNAKEPPPAKPKGMLQKKVRCFEPNDLPQARIPEFDRQLAGQERGLNAMTVEEYLKGREAFDSKEIVRNPSVARAARSDYQEQLTDKLFRQLQSEGLSARDADKKAAEMAADKMKTLAALHNPDMKVGGGDLIADFGDRNVNSRIGAQWKTRVAELDKAAKHIPKIDRSSIKMNAKLERCK